METGPHLVTALRAAGVSLHLDAQGKLHCTPPAVAQPYRAAIRQHLPYLLVCAAVAEVQQLMRTQSLERLARLPAAAVATALYAASDRGDIEATRREAVAYVTRWRQWLTQQGDDDGPLDLD